MKLTIAMKERIIRSILHDTFSARESAYQAAYAALADEVYASYYTAGILKKMSELPENLFISKSSFDFCVDGDRSSRTLCMTTTRLFGQCHHYSAIRIDANSGFVDRYREIEQKCRAASADKQALRETLKSVILPVTTDKKLAEVWPDAEKWIPRTPAAMANLPAVRPEELNATIERMKGAE